MKTINITEKTLDEAITQACVELSVTSDRLSYEILQQGSGGFFGIGARDYVIKAWVKGEDKEDKKEEKTKKKSEKDTKKTVKHKTKQEKTKNETEEKSYKTEEKSYKKKDKKQEKKAKKTKSEPAADRPHKERRPVELTEDPVERAETFLQDVIGCMKAKCDFSAEYAADTATLKINLTGDDVSTLIGQHGQTLDALRYLTSQVVNKHQHGYIRVKIDTENYREQRKEALEALAHSMAQKAVAGQKPVLLEPMNAYERRIVHSSLKPEDGVTTRSEGEEPYRHIVICPIKK